MLCRTFDFFNPHNHNWMIQHLKLANGRVFIKPSSELPLIVNGRQTVLNAEGTWHDLDMSGEVALIIPTTGMTVQPLQVSQCRSADGFEFVIGGTSIDPSARVLKQLETLSTPKGIEDAKTRYHDHRCRVRSRRRGDQAGL